MFSTVIFLLFNLGTYVLPSKAVAATQAEYHALQQWCSEYLKWNRGGRKGQLSIPEGYLYGVGHYCSALQAMQSLYSTTNKANMRHQAGLVMGETGYVIGHNPESHPLMPEVYALRGKAMAIVKENASAETNLLKALQLDPSHVAAYVTLANFYLDTKRRQRAEETVKTALAVDSQNKALRRLASELGVALEAMKPEAVNVEPVATPSTRTEADTTEPAGMSPEVGPAPDTTATPPETPKIGSPTNPWCRFCPDPVVEP